MFSIKTFTFNPFAENTYLLYNEFGTCIIIDPGCYSSDEAIKLFDFIQKNQLEPKYLLQTHCHLDHVFGTARISETYQLKPYLHKEEYEIYSKAALIANSYGLNMEDLPNQVTYYTENAIINLDSDVLEGFNIITYPNPTTGFTAIQFNVLNDSKAEVAIFDITGRKLIQVINEYVPAGQYVYEVDLSVLANGVYYTSILTDEQVTTSRTIITK
jgi:ribonuclease BN (tRNA processing enzyme)